MSKQSAGLLVFRRSGQTVEVMLVHPGGPIYGRQDLWSIPKGELDDGEDHLAAAYREFTEEVGVKAPQGKLIDLGSNKQRSGKTNFIWAVEGDVDITQFSSNNFTMQWPPRSGKTQEFPENGRAAWFELDNAKQKIFDTQVIFLERLARELNKPGTP